jgi:hypothetical protein
MRDAAGMPAGAETGLTAEEPVYRRRGPGTRAASATKLSGAAVRIPAGAIGPIPVRGGSGVQWHIRGCWSWAEREKLSWDSETRHPARAVWNAVASVPMNEDPTINLRLFFHPPPS